MAWGGCTGVNGTGVGHGDEIWTPFFLGSAINLTPGSTRQTGSQKHHRQEADTLLSVRSILFHWLGWGSEQAEGLGLQIGQEDVAWDREAPKESSGAPRPRDVAEARAKQGRAAKFIFSPLVISFLSGKIARITIP